MFRRTRHIHFIGIGGIGMSGMAELLHKLGFQISGSDNNIMSKFVDIDEKCIYMVSCLPGTEPCLLQDKKLVKELGNDFYIRKKANSLPLVGQDQQDYIRNRFYSSEK